MITLILADDHEIVREGLRALLEKANDIKVVAEAGDGRSAVKLAQKHKPRIVVMDIGMPDLNGTDATNQIVSTIPGVKVIALSGLSDHFIVQNVLKAGASGYVLKDDAFNELVTAVHEVAEGKSYLSPGITDVVVDALRANSDCKGVFGSLTSREREVLQLLAEGRTNKEVAEELSISVQTVHTHRKNVMDKLRLNSMAELTKYAVREGLTSL